MQTITVMLKGTCRNRSYIVTVYFIVRSMQRAPPTFGRKLANTGNDERIVITGHKPVQTHNCSVDRLFINVVKLHRGRCGISCEFCKTRLANTKYISNSTSYIPCLIYEVSFNVWDWQSTSKFNREYETNLRQILQNRYKSNIHCWNDIVI